MSFSFSVRNTARNHHSISIIAAVRYVDVVAMEEVEHQVQIRIMQTKNFLFKHTKNVFVAFVFGRQSAILNNIAKPAQQKYRRQRERWGVEEGHHFNINKNVCMCVLVFLTSSTSVFCAMGKITLRR